jgi:hypothetical protein
MGGFRKEVKAILKHGITEEGTRYFLQSKLVYHFWSLNYSKEECYNSIRQWYLSHDHRSKDWRKDPERVLRQLRSAVNCLYRNAEFKGYRPGARNRKKLRVKDVESITKMTSDYRTQKFIFCLLEYALNAKDSNGLFRLPKKTVIKFDCCSNESYRQKIEFCESIRLIEKVREFYRQERRARTYRIIFMFSTDSEIVENLEEGLRRIWDEPDLRNRYSRHYLRHILKDHTRR